MATRIFFAPAQQHAAAATPARFGHLFGRGGRADQADAAHFGAFIPGSRNGPVSVNNIDDAAGQPDGLGNTTNLLHEKRGLRRWFVDEGIADSDGVWDKPGKDQGREIEGSHPPNTPRGSLTTRPLILAGSPGGFPPAIGLGQSRRSR